MLNGHLMGCVVLDLTPSVTEVREAALHAVTVIRQESSLLLVDLFSCVQVEKNTEHHGRAYLGVEDNRITRFVVEKGHKLVGGNDTDEQCDDAEHFLRGTFGLILPLLFLPCGVVYSRATGKTL